MRVCHLITSLEGGGTENFLLQLLKHAPSGVVQDVCYLKRDGVIGDAIRRLGLSPQRVSPIALYRRWRQRPPDVVHTLLYRAHQLGRWIGRQAGVRRIVSSQRAIDAWMKPWHVAVDRWTLPYAHLVVANSGAAAELIRQRLGRPGGPDIEILHNGSDLERFERRDRETSRRALGLPERPLLGGIQLRLHSEKGADHLPALASSLLSRFPDLHLAVAGVGPLELRLKQTTRGQPWSPRLHWLGWVDDAPAFLSAVDFAWNMSREESFPQSLLDASVMGVPWAAPAVGGIGELLTLGAVGHCDPALQSGSSEPIAHLLRNLTDWQERARMAAGPLRSKVDVKKIAALFFDRLQFPPS